MRLLKLGLCLLALRELPLRHFYARALITGLFLHYVVSYHWRWGHFNYPTIYYRSDRDQRELDNYPLVKQLVTKRIVAKVHSPTIMESDFWYRHQLPVFYQHHFKHMRYILRKKREVQWDGTFNQPIFPFTGLNDRGLFVHNGILESVEPKASGNW